jgi:hypothetical protein
MSRSYLDAYRDQFTTARRERTATGLLTITLHKDGGPVVYDRAAHEE